MIQSRTNHGRLWDGIQQIDLTLKNLAGRTLGGGQQFADLRDGARERAEEREEERREERRQDRQEHRMFLVSCCNFNEKKLK